MPAAPGKPDPFKTGLGFAVALLPVLAVVWAVFPDGSACPPEATRPDGDCGFWLARYAGSGTVPALLAVAGGAAVLLWLAAGLRFFAAKLRSMDAGHARNALFFYAILTCAAFFLILPVAVITVIIVAICGEIILRFGPAGRGTDAPE